MGVRKRRKITHPLGKGRGKKASHSAQIGNRFRVKGELRKETKKGRISYLRGGKGYIESASARGRWEPGDSTKRLF